MKSVGLQDNTHKKLKKLSATLNMSQGEFIDFAVTYFERVGLDPNTNVDILKRIDQLIRFIRTFEKENLIPLYKETIKANQVSIETSKKLPSSEDFGKVSNAIMALRQSINELKDGMNQHFRLQSGELSALSRSIQLSKGEILTAILDNKSREAIARQNGIDYKKGIF